MGRINKTLALLLSLIVTMSCFSLFVVNPANAQSIPKPSVPEFTLQYVDHSYDVPPTYGIDSYTGHNIMVQDGYHIQNKSIDVILSNPHFTPFENGKVNNLAIWYDVRWKGHFGTYWQDTNRSTYLLASNCGFVQNENDLQLVSPDAPFTILPIGFNNNNGTAYTSNNDLAHYSFFMNDFSLDGKVDFQVQAFIGYYTTQQSAPDPMFGRTNTIYFFHGESSGWSNTQTISIPDGKVTTSELTNSTVTSTPTAPELSWLAIVPLLLSIFVVAVVVRHRKTAYLKQ
jgi:hypothetical protein